MFLLKSVSLPFLYLGNAMCWSIQHSRNPSELCLPHDKRPYPSEALHGRTHQHRNMREMPGFGRKVGSFLEILVIWWWCGCDVHPIPMDGRTRKSKNGSAETPNLMSSVKYLENHGFAISAVLDSGWKKHESTGFSQRNASRCIGKNQVIYQSFQQEFKVGICQKLLVIGMHRLQESLILWEP